MIKRTNQKKKKGFSLIELIIVLAVMAIIALIAIPNFNAVKENSKVKADVQSGNALARSVETLLVDESITIEGTKGNGVITITNSSAKVKNIVVDGKIFEKEADLVKYLANLVDANPQEKDKVGYILTVDKDTFKVTSVTGTTEEIGKAVE